MSNLLRNTLLIAWMNSVPDMKRQPLMIVMMMMIGIIPLFFILIFASGGAQMMKYGLIGALVANIGIMGITTPIQQISWDRYVKIREMMVAMPVHPLSYAMGAALAGLILSTPGFVLFLALSMFYNLLTVGTLLVALAAIILCWLALSVMGFTIATYLYKSNANTLGMASMLLGFVFVFIPPVYYPEQMLGAFSWVAYLVPTSNACALVRYATGATAMDWGAFGLHWVALAVMVVVFALLSVYKARWRET